MSETFLVAFEKRAAYDLAIVDARPWLFGIATRLMHKHVRLEARAWKGMVADLAAQLSPDMIEQAGDTLLLYAWGDLDYAGIARALDVPIGTVRSRLNRARRILRTAAGTNDPELEKEHGRVDAAAQHA